MIENVCKRGQIYSNCIHFHGFLKCMHNDDIMYTWNKKNGTRYAFQRVYLRRLDKQHKRIIVLSMGRLSGLCVAIWKNGKGNSAVLLCKKIKLEVTEQDAATLEFMQGKCRGLYNWWVMKLRNGEKWNVYEAKKSLQQSKQHDPELNAVYGKLLAEVYCRLDGAMQAFFRRVENGETPGFPRVRPRHCFFTLCYPATYIKVQGNILILPTGGGGKHGPKRFANIEATLTEIPPQAFAR